MKLEPKAILFDMDGVLIDSFDVWWKSLNVALKAYNYDEVSKEEFENIYWGHGLRDNVKKMGFTKEIGDYCNSVYYNHVGEIKIFNDTKIILQQLKKYRKSIITNTPKKIAKKILKRFEIENYFNHIITSDDVVKEKPDPEIIYIACEKISVQPKEVVLIGDTKNDIMAGKAAGCIVIGVRIKGDYIVNSLSELLDIIR